MGEVKSEVPVATEVATEVAVETPTEVKVTPLVMPSRQELRRLKKTGKDAQGNEARPQDVANLRKATIADLIAFGVEVNKANNALNAKVEQLSINTQVAITEVNFIITNIIPFLVGKEVLTPAALQEFEDHVESMKQELEKALDFAKNLGDTQATEAQDKKVSVSDLDPTKEPNVITIDEIKAKNSGKPSKIILPS